LLLVLRRIVNSRLRGVLRPHVEVAFVVALLQLARRLTGDWPEKANPPYAIGFSSAPTPVAS
jgi:hypothetical protein